MDAGADAAEGKERRRSMPHLSPAATLCVSLYYRLIVLPAHCIAGSLYCRLRVLPAPHLAVPLLRAPLLPVPLLPVPLLPVLLRPVPPLPISMPLLHALRPTSWFPPLPPVPLQAVSLRHALRPAP